MSTQKKDRIIIGNVSNHRSSNRYTNADWGTVAYFIPKNDFVVNKKFIEADLNYNSIYFLIGYEQDNNNSLIEKNVCRTSRHTR